MTVINTNTASINAQFNSEQSEQRDGGRHGAAFHPANESIQPLMMLQVWRSRRALHQKLKASKWQSEMLLTARH